MSLKSILVWIDLEMTGLNPEVDSILEISTMITNNALEILACGPSLVINQSDVALSVMDEWNIQTHTKSGLIGEVQQSIVSLADAEVATLDFLKQHCKEKEAPLCGNSVWQDRRFLTKHMPKIEEYLNYRIVDVSSIKEIVARWYPDSPERRFKKPDGHRACEDIKQSIEELKHYRKYFFIQ